MAVPNPNNIWPFPNSPNQMKRVLYQFGVDPVAEDFDWESKFREEEDIVRFLAICKTTGIVAKKANSDLYLAPSGITGTQVRVSKATGFTPNGGRITLENDLTPTDATILPGYVSDMSVNLYLVLRKKELDYAPRSNFLSGIQSPTRRLIKFDNSVLEWVTDATVDTDRDIIVLGRRTGISPFTFDLTEDTGKRKILRVGEVPFLDTTGGVMFGDIDMQRKYEVKNLPSINGFNWSYSGAANKEDLIRLFAKTGYIMGLLKGIVFEQFSTNFRIRFDSNADVKIKLFNDQKPGLPIEIRQNGKFLNIPDNSVVQILLTDSQLLSTSTPPPPGGGGGIGGEDGPSPDLNNPVVDPTFSTFPYLTTTNNYDFHKIPICFHSVEAGVHRLIFANGFILNLGESIDSDGMYSGFVRRDGGNDMFGNLRINKPSPQIELVNTSNSDISGIVIKNSSGNPIGTIFRYSAALRGQTPVPDLDPEAGDLLITLNDNNGSNPSFFLLKQKGTIRTTVPAANGYDLARLGEVINSLNLKFDKVGGVISGTTSIQNTNPIFNLWYKAITRNGDTDPTGWYRILNRDGNVVSYWTRRPQSTGYNDGDLEFGAFNRDGGGLVKAILRRLSDGVGRWDIDNLFVLNDGTVGHVLNFVDLGAGATGKTQINTLWDASHNATNPRNRNQIQVNSPQDATTKFLLNHTDKGSGDPSFVVNSGSDMFTDISVFLPGVGNFISLLVVFNYTLSFGTIADGEQYVFKIKDAGSNVVFQFKENYPSSSYLSGAKISKTKSWIVRNDQLTFSSVQSTILQVFASKATNNFNIVNSVTDGVSDISYIVLN